MNISFFSSCETECNKYRNSVMERLNRTLARFSDRISRVDVALTDENGPRGGVDKQCRVNVLLPGIGAISTTARNDDSWAAVAQAARRARRIVITNLKRPQAQRARDHRSHWENNVAPEQQEL